MNYSSFLDFTRNNERTSGIFVPCMLTRNNWTTQGHFRLFESGTAIEAVDVHRVTKARVGVEHKRGYAPLSLGRLGGSPP